MNGYKISQVHHIQAGQYIVEYISVYNLCYDLTYENVPGVVIHHNKQDIAIDNRHDNRHDQLKLTRCLKNDYLKLPSYFAIKIGFLLKQRRPTHYICLIVLSGQGHIISKNPDKNDCNRLNRISHLDE